MPGQFLPADHSRGDANTIGGYMAVHARPAAFEGSDGFSYSVELMTEATDAPDTPWAAFILFVKWSRLGAQSPEGHLETQYLAQGATEADAKRLIGEMLAGDLIPTLMIAVGSIGLAWMGVSHGIAPLARVTSDLLGRSPRDLRPLDGSIAPTEIAPVVDAFNRLLSQLRESTAIQQRFLADAAHQLRTPLAGLQMHLELLLQRPLTADVRKEVEMMQSATLRASHLANQLLVLAKAEAGAIALAHPQEINLRSLAHQAVQEWVPRAIARDIDLGFELRDATVEGDPLLLGELLDNLIDNALRYTPSGGAVTVRCGYEGESACLSVEDSGSGIPIWAREKVFERFFRIEGSPGNGSGLGLAIVKEVVEQHGAALKLDTPGDVGTRISILFVSSSRRENTAAPG